jgi:septum site-determining protein MinC
MPRRREPRPAPALELKTTRLAGIQVILNSAEHAVLAAHISTLFAATPDFFGGEAAVFECGRLPADAAPPDWAWLAQELKSRGLNPFAVQNASDELAAAAAQAGLLVLNTAAPAPAAEPEPKAAPAPVPATAPTRIVDKPLRSGQRVYAAGGDIVVLAAVSPGAEVIADGSIRVCAAQGPGARRCARRHLGAHLHHPSRGRTGLDRGRVSHLRIRTGCRRGEEAGANPSGRSQPDRHRTSLTPNK